MKDFEPLKHRKARTLIKLGSYEVNRGHQVQMKTRVCYWMTLSTEDWVQDSWGDESMTVTCGHDSYWRLRLRCRQHTKLGDTRLCSTCQSYCLNHLAGYDKSGLNVSLKSKADTKMYAVWSKFHIVQLNARAYMSGGVSNPMCWIFGWREVGSGKWAID